MSRRAIASGGGRPSDPRPATASATSARSNQRTSSTSSRGRGSPPAQSATKPSMSELGNGQGCEET